jgi:hypothetical protein
MLVTLQLVSGNLIDKVRWAMLGDSKRRKNA